MGVYVENTRKYKRALVIASTISIIGPIALLTTLYSGLVWPVCIASFVLGFDLCILPVGIDFGVETTFPIAESISTGILMSFSMIIGVILVITCTTLITEYKEPGCLYSQGILIGMAVVGLIFACITKEDLKRLKFENSESKIE